MTKTTWKKVDPALRAELEALLAHPTDAWLSTYHDTMAWWLLLLLASVGGFGVGVWYFATETGGFFGFLEYASDPVTILRALFLSPARLGLVASIVVGVAVAVTWVRNHNRRGFAATREAIVLVRGPGLVVIPRREIVATATRRVAVRGAQRFTVVTLTFADGRTKELNVHGTWAAAAFPTSS